MQHLSGIRIIKLRFSRLRGLRCREQLPGGPAGDGGTHSSSVGDMLDELEWPSLEARREQSSLTFFYKIHFGTVSLEKDKYSTPAPKSRRTWASHDSQYTRYLVYSDALKNSFFPRTIPVRRFLPKPLRILRPLFTIFVPEACVLACL